MTDEELVALAQQGDSQAIEQLIERYRGAVWRLAMGWFAPGEEKEDLAQEAYLGLWTAIKNYDPARSISFSKFALLAMRRKVCSALTAANRLKHRAMNEAFSLNSTHREDEGRALLEILPAVPSSEQVCLEREGYNELLRRLRDVASPLEWEVFVRLYTGASYEETARAIGLDYKAVDNAFQRFRRKLQKAV